MTTPEDNPVNHEIRDAIDNNQVTTVQKLLSQHPDSLEVYMVSETWLHRAARVDNVELMDFFLGAGINVNVPSRGTWGPPIMSAIHYGSPRGVRHLLNRGADPNASRAVIAAINHSEPAVGLEITKLFVEHGADINRVFPWSGDKKLRFTPLSWAVFSGKHEIADYLRSQGAKMPPGEQDPGPPTIGEEIVAFMAQKFGPVEALSLDEIVPMGMPISIHLIPPCEGRNHITLFTTGMSRQPMNVPAGAGQHALAELAINLPSDWPLPVQETGGRSVFGWLKRKKSPDEAAIARSLWPIQWLRTIARYPHENETWLGGAATIFANGDPPQPLAPGVPFTSFLMMNTDQILCRHGRAIQLYQLLPLYTEERALEIAEDLPALLRKLDSNNIPWVVDLHRPNVAAIKK